MRKEYEYTTEWAKTDFIKGGERTFDHESFGKVFRQSNVYECAKRAIAEAKENPRYKKDALAIKDVNIWWGEGTSHLGSTPVKVLRIKFYTVCKRPGAFMNNLRREIKNELEKVDPTFVGGSIRQIKSKQ